MTEPVLFADGFDGALIGLGTQFTQPVAVYDLDKCREILAAQGVPAEQIDEHLEFNVLGAWVGPATPVFITCQSYECAQEQARALDDDAA